MKKTVSFSSASVSFFFDSPLAQLEKLVDAGNAIIITDDHVYHHYKKKLTRFKTIVIPAGEEYKIQSTVDNIITQLIEAGADRSTTLIGVGGGVITDITGYVAGIFMRGIAFGFVPTSILGMVDAAIGGKNGIDVGVYKNMVGLIRQPSFILYDYTLLKTLPKAEWINGFAEIIKHACIKDKKMVAFLKDKKLSSFQNDLVALSKLIRQNAAIKIKVVQDDEYEKGDRKLLNFGHTFGHAIENLYHIPHGHAVSIGMGLACTISEQINGFKQAAEVTSLLKQYGLPPQFEFDRAATMKILQSDKKKQGKSIHFVLLQQIGKAVITPISMDELNELIQ